MAATETDTAPKEDVLKRERKFAYNKGEVNFNIAYSIETTEKALKEIDTLVEMLHMAINDSLKLREELINENTK